MLETVKENIPNDSICCTSLLVVGAALYYLYLRKFRVYKYQQVDDIKDDDAVRPRGKCPPFFPNGWYSLMNCNELNKNEVKHIDYCGRNIALFRGSNDKVYALDAFCAHMGANLGIGGKVKNSCIQCPFHGWMFDGETGNCVQSSELSKKKVNQFKYNDLKDQKVVDGDYLHECYEGNINLKKYHVRELNGSILIWFDARKEFQDTIPYEPLDLMTKLDYRGESINYVNCHCQEIPENGADIRHFDFLHTNVFDYISFIKFDWLMKSHRAQEEDLYEVMKHKIDYFNDFKMKLLNRYLTEDNKKYVNVIYLDCYIKVFGFKYFLFNLTGFQVGPGLVYLFLKSYFFETAFAQSVTPLKKFKLRVSHKIFTNNYLPYWLSSYMLYGEVKQLFSDMAIWNNKNFGSKLTYNLKTDADKNLLSWRNWFAQFYEGCHEFEKKQTELDW